MSTVINPEKQKQLEEKLPDVSENQLDYSLADAIREGASVTGECVGWYNEKGENLCALSAAILAMKARHLL